MMLGLGMSSDNHLQHKGAVAVATGLLQLKMIRLVQLR